MLSLDEKSQIQALDRTQAGLPIKPGRCQTMTHDYKRHGTTTLFAALSVLDGTVIGRCMQHHRHLEFIRFLNAVECQVPAGKPVHAVLDNYATHKHPKVLAWLSRHLRWTFHFTPTCSAANWIGTERRSGWGGRAGGFPGWVNECFAGGRQSRGIERVKITYEIALISAIGVSRSSAGSSRGPRRSSGQPARPGSIRS